MDIYSKSSERLATSVKAAQIALFLRTKLFTATRKSTMLSVADRRLLSSVLLTAVAIIVALVFLAVVALLILAILTAAPCAPPHNLSQNPSSEEIHYQYSFMPYDFEKRSFYVEEA